MNIEDEKNNQWFEDEDYTEEKAPKADDLSCNQWFEDEELSIAPVETKASTPVATLSCSSAQRAEEYSEEERLMAVRDAWFIIVQNHDSYLGFNANTVPVIYNSLSELSNEDLVACFFAHLFSHEPSRIVLIKNWFSRPLNQTYGAESGNNVELFVKTVLTGSYKLEVDQEFLYIFPIRDMYIQLAAIEQIATLQIIALFIQRGFFQEKRIRDDMMNMRFQSFKYNAIIQHFVDPAMLIAQYLVNAMRTPPQKRTEVLVKPFDSVMSWLKQRYDGGLVSKKLWEDMSQMQVSLQQKTIRTPEFGKFIHPKSCMADE